MATTEQQEMREEIERVMERTHPWMMLQQALAERDEEVARMVLEVGHDRLTGRQRLSASQSIKAFFPETPEQWRERQDATGAETRSVVGDSLATRLGRRREQAQKIAARTQAHAGEHVARREGVRYSEPNVGGFNTPVGMDKPERRGFNRIRGLFNQPEGEAS